MKDRHQENKQTYSSSKDGYCAESRDRIHCQHWWDGDECCVCHAEAMTDEEKKEQGMDLQK